MNETCKVNSQPFMGGLVGKQADQVGAANEKIDGLLIQLGGPAPCESKDTNKPPIAGMLDAMLANCDGLDAALIKLDILIKYICG